MTEKMIPSILFTHDISLILCVREETKFIAINTMDRLVLFRALPFLSPDKTILLISIHLASVDM